MSATSILPARAQIKDLSKEELRSYKDELLSMSTADEVEAFIREKTNQ
jgi:phosphotransferase system enzyme I (PtsI)